jgi:molybdopterin-binding protein
VTVERSMLDASDIEVRYGEARALWVPALSVKRSEVIALIGPNGAGKSTLLLILALLRRPDAGEVWIDGEQATHANELTLRRRMAVVFQEPLLLDTSVERNVATGLQLRGVPASERRRRAAIWIERFGIGHLATRSARGLSGGEAQRTSLARAFALDPEVLFLDEPFSALDAPTRASITQDLLGALRSTGTTAVLVTHDRDEALAFGDRIGVLIRGELKQLGPPGDVFGAPSDVEVAEFVGVETIAPGTVVAQEEGLARVRVGEQMVDVVSPLPTGTPVLLCLRPEDVTLQPWVEGELAPSSARNRLAGRVVGTGVWASQVRVVVDCGFPLAVAITRRSAAELGIAVGSRVLASFKATSAHLIPRN